MSRIQNPLADDVLASSDTYVSHKGQTVSSMAAPETVAAEPPIRDTTMDFNGDGRSDLLWRNASDGTLIEWLGQENGSYAYNSVATNYLPTTWHIIATGDFNGDTRDDILWRHDSGRIIEWTGQTDGSFALNSLVGVDLGLDWNFAGSADFNGDNRDEVLFRRDDGLVVTWVAQADGTFVQSPATYAMPTDWTLVSTSDFTGDGRADILWRHDSGVVIEWVGQATGNPFAWDPNISYALPTDWTMAATADFNGDGRTDIVWRHNAGNTIEWLGQADGSFWYNAAANSTLGTNWHVNGVGDVNGDHRDDILWVSDSGAVTSWLGQDNGSFSPNLYTYQMPAEWHAQPELGLLF